MSTPRRLAFWVLAATSAVGCRSTAVDAIRAAASAGATSFADTTSAAGTAADTSQPMRDASPVSERPGPRSFPAPPGGFQNDAGVCESVAVLPKYGVFSLRAASSGGCFTSEEFEPGGFGLPVVSTRVTRHCDGTIAQLWQVYVSDDLPPALPSRTSDIGDAGLDEASVDGAAAPVADAPDADDTLPPPSSDSASGAPGVAPSGAVPVKTPPPPPPMLPPTQTAILYKDGIEYTLAIEDDRREAGADVVLMPIRGRFPELLKFIQLPGNSFMISPTRARALCVTETGGDAELWPCEPGNAGQQWKLIPENCD